MDKMTFLSGGPASETRGLSSRNVKIMPAMPGHGSQDPGACAEAENGLAAHQRPGYQLCAYVKNFITTPVGPVPVVHPRPGPADRWATLTVRCGIGRDQYRVAPGLYAMGRPDSTSEVLVTANFKLTFDILRKELAQMHVWILVLDTRGIKVWCAAGKGTFPPGNWPGG